MLLRNTVGGQVQNEGRKIGKKEKSNCSDLQQTPQRIREDQ